jgi:urocanate hydratase
LEFVPGQDRQEATLAVYAALAAMRADWCGRLIVSCGLGPVGCAVAMAAHVAGAACVSIEPDAGVCRAAMRAGACDFLVNTVEEALRALKNEVRKKQPLSVALECGTEPALEELMERGVLPELFAGGGDRAWEGAARMGFEAGLRLPEGMQMRSFAAGSPGALKVLEERLRIAVGGDWRGRWLSSAPRLFYRERPFRRAMLLTDAEWARLV